MTPSDIANEALNSTLEAVQPLMKRCMKLKESDPTALIFSDEIARRVVSLTANFCEMYFVLITNSIWRRQKI
jgi:hypothetical protein